MDLEYHIIVSLMWQPGVHGRSFSPTPLQRLVATRYVQAKGEKGYKGKQKENSTMQFPYVMAFVSNVSEPMTVVFQTPKQFWRCSQISLLIKAYSTDLF